MIYLCRRIYLCVRVQEYAYYVNKLRQNASLEA